MLLIFLAAEAGGLPRAGGVSASCRCKARAKSKSSPRAMLRTWGWSSSRGLHTSVKSIEQHVLKKVKRGLDRLPREGPDPAANFKHGWRLASAAILERYPAVTPDPHKFEADYLLGRFIDQQKRARPIPAHLFLSEKDRLEGRTEPNFDDPVADKYVPAPRVTEADATNDQKSLDRALKERLYFVIRRSKNSAHMQFPQVLVSKDEIKMKDYAESALKSVTLPASRPVFHFVSYSPACHLEHVYPLSYQQKHDVYGVKIFFYRAMLLSGDASQIRNCEDYMWARDCELPDLLGQEYYSAIKPALLGNGPTIHASDRAEL